MRKISTAQWLLILCLQVVIAGLGAWMWLDWHNTLAQNSHWVVAKRNLALAVMGSEQFYNDRQALAGGALHLGSWHGYQQVTYRDQLELKQLHVDFDMDEGSYLYIIFGSDGSDQYALRLSTQRMYRNAWLKLKDTGEFIETTPMPAAKLVARGNRVSLLLNQDRNEVGIILNGDYYGHFQVPPFFIKTVSFRNGNQDVTINRVVVRSFENKVLVDESFDNQESWPTAAGRVLAVLLIIDASILLLEMRLTLPAKWSLSKSGRVWLPVTLSVTLVLLLTAIFQRYFAARYPQFTGWFTNIFEAEQRYLEIHSLEMTEEFFKKYTLDPAPHTYRVLMIGSSQTWGAGANQPDEGMVSVINTLANKELAAPNRKYEFIPTAVSGQQAADLYTLYEQHWKAFKPNMIIVNLSNNDDDPERFKENLERFAEFTAKQRIPLLFVLEANSTEYRPVLENHAAMKQVAQKYAIPLIDAHSYMATQEQSGILWWDYVHPTTYGHQVLGTYIYQNIKQHLITGK